MNSGSYIARIPEGPPGLLKVSVTINDSHIRGSPFTLLRIPRDYSAISGPTSILHTSTFLNSCRMKGVATPEEGSPIDANKTAPWSRGFCLGQNAEYIFTDSTSHGFHKVENSTLCFSITKKGGQAGQFSSPKAVCCSAGKIFIADTQNHRIQVFYEKDGAFSYAFGSRGTRDGHFMSPSGVAFFLPKKLVVVADTMNHRVQVFHKQELQSKFGTRGSEPGQFNKPVGVAVNSKQEIIVSDSGNHRIQVFNSSGELLRLFGTHGSKTGQFSTPCHVAIDSYDNIFVCDTNNGRVQVFDANGRHITSIDLRNRYPFGIDIDSDGKVFIAEFGVGGSFITVF